MTGQREISLPEYAAREDMAYQAAFKRVQRGVVRARQDEHRRWWVLEDDPGQAPASQREHSEALPQQWQQERDFMRLVIANQNEHIRLLSRAIENLTNGKNV